MRVQSLVQEDLLEEEMATHSSTLVGNPMDRGVWGATVHGVAKSQTQLSTHTQVQLLQSTNSMHLYPPGAN